MSAPRRIVAALALVVAVPTLVAASPALADAPQPVPDHATITFTGDGYGHGKGMSQWGAQGAARAGLGYQQILGFYYPGTALGDLGGRIKVRVTADDDSDLVVDDRAGLTVRNLSTGRSWKLDEPGARRWRIRPVATGNEISYRTRSWHTWRTVRADAEFAADGAPVALRTPAGVVAYRGALRSTMYDDGQTVRRVTVNVLSLDGYVRGVVPREVIASTWAPQALRAQAVAARTYAAYERDHTNRTAYDLCDTAACQVYGGYSAEYPTSNDAVAATARQVVTYQGEVAFAQFSASNGGYTVADAAFPYLKAQPDTYDEQMGQYYGWTTTLSDADIEAQWPKVGNLSSISIDTRDGNDLVPSRGGRVVTMTLSGDGQPVTVSGETFRSRFGLRSTLFTISSVASASGRSVPTD